MNVDREKIEGVIDSILKEFKEKEIGSIEALAICLSLTQGSICGSPAPRVFLKAFNQTLHNLMDECT